MELFVKAVVEEVRKVLMEGGGRDTCGLRDRGRGSVRDVEKWEI